MSTGRHSNGAIRPTERFRPDTAREDRFANRMLWPQSIRGGNAAAS
jgi:hypothetical protein